MDTSSAKYYETQRSLPDQVDTTRVFTPKKSGGSSTDKIKITKKLFRKITALCNAIHHQFMLIIHSFPSVQRNLGVSFHNRINKLKQLNDELKAWKLLKAQMGHNSIPETEDQKAASRIIEINIINLMTKIVKQGHKLNETSRIISKYGSSIPRKVREKYDGNLTQENLSPARATIFFSNLRKQLDKKLSKIEDQKIILSYQPSTPKYAHALKKIEDSIKTWTILLNLVQECERPLRDLHAEETAQNNTVTDMEQSEIVESFKAASDDEK